MSRPDLHDVEYSPGLNFLRNGSGERESFSGYHNPSSYPTADRRPSNTAMSSPYSLYGSSGGARAGLGGGMNEWEQHESVMNKHSQTNPSGQAYLGFNQHHHPQRPAPLSTNSMYGNSYSGDHRENQMYRQQMTSPPATALSPTNATQSNAAQMARSTLWWGDLEAWMDEEYAKQVCKLMAWDPLSIKVPHPPPDPSSGQQANNPGYCFLTFHSPVQAQAVLNQISAGPTPITMPNSAKPFSMNWASSAPSATAAVPQTYSAPPAPPPPQQESTTPTSHTPQFTKEYSIFVGDLAPETSNSDLVAVFRNPVLGLRNDREPKFIRPFLSCKSAKIMLDPVTGVSRGYGFVRFTDESDQQRALIEMHGLYCLSRPMRISPATAKFKAPSTMNPGELPVQFSYSGGGTPPVQPPTKSVSASIATVNSGSSLHSNGSSMGHMGASGSNGSMPSGLGSSSSLATSFASASSDDMLNLPTSVLAQIAQQYANGDAHPVKPPTSTPSITSQFVSDGSAPHGRMSEHGPRYMISEESWKHHAQARAILGNLIGPNGEQLTSTDPYNTTVFVGGLSPLINEDTLRTFFAPFGDIHYVKVPVGKHCGFVQFVRKADAERAIEKMQGFPVGGSRIRLSWGRSQYKAAQAAAQAAQTAALSGQYQSPAGPSMAPESNPFGNITPEQAYHILQKIAASHGSNSAAMDNATAQLESMTNHGINPGLYADEDLRAAQLTSPDDIRPYEAYSPTALTSGRARASPSPMGTQQYQAQQQQPQQQPRQSHAPGAPFSPFSTESGGYGRDQSSQGMGGPWKYLGSRDTSESASPVENETIKASTTRPASAARYGPFLNGSPPSSQTSRTPVRMEAPISRPATDKPGHAGQDYDALHDLNGTLASLDLDRPWKSPAQSSESSGTSVQFRLSVDHGSSP